MAVAKRRRFAMNPVETVMPHWLAAAAVKVARSSGPPRRCWPASRAAIAWPSRSFPPELVPPREIA